MSLAGGRTALPSRSASSLPRQSRLRPLAGAVAYTVERRADEHAAHHSGNALRAQASLPSDRNMADDHRFG